MSLTAIMLEQLTAVRRIVVIGHEVVPAWRIDTPEGVYLILTRFDQHKPEQRERVLVLMSQFMAWKMATNFVLAAETWLGPTLTRAGEEALLVVGVSHHERFGLIQRINRKKGVQFGSEQWLMPDQVDETYFKILPTGAETSFTYDEIAELEAIFGRDGELAAERLS